MDFIIIIIMLVVGSLTSLMWVLQDKVNYVTLDRIKDVYHLKCHPLVMIQQRTPDEAIEDFLNESFALIQKVTEFDVNEYYLLIGASVPEDKQFELMFIKSWKVCK